MRRSTVSGNVVGGQSTGGGIAISGGSTTNTLENCTISGNHAASGGGVASTGGAPVTLLNCTIAGNAAAGVNGGAPANGGGLLGIFTASDSIVAGNSSVTNAGPDCAGTLTSGGYDLIQDVGDCTVSAGPGNLTGLDAQLAPLADNGGTVTPHPLTRAPLPLSPVVNAGNPATPGTPGACAATDERGVARPQPPGDRCDIGAFEDVHPVTTTTTSTTTTTTVTTITVATTTTSTSVTVSTTLATSTTAESTSTTSPSTTSTSATISTGPTTSTTGPGGSTTTTTTVPGTPEICGDCIDNDGNGLTDFEDPACCVGDHVVTLTWKRGRIRPGGAISALRLRTRLATTAGIDPKHQTVYVQLRQDGGGELLCAQIPTTDLLKAVGGYVFRDPAHRVKSADGLTRLRLVVTKKGVGKLTTSTKDAPFRTPVASLLTLTVAFHDPAHPDGDRCAASTQSFNATRKGALHFP